MTDTPRAFEIEIQGISDLMYGKPIASKKQSNETHEQFEERTWQEKVHMRNGHCFIPAFAVKNGLESAARWLSMSIPGEGKKTFTRRFASGSFVIDNVSLQQSNGQPVLLEQVTPISLFVPSTGKRGDSKRVFRTFPTVREWQGVMKVYLLDGKISPEVLAAHCEAFGKFIGLGSMRVENGGINGRFQVLDVRQVE